MDYEYFSKHYKLVAIDLSKQIELENPDLKQRVNFTGKLKEDNEATMTFIIEKKEQTLFEFLQNSVMLQVTNNLNSLQKMVCYRHSNSKR